MRKFLLAAVLAAFSVSANAQVVPFGTLGGGSASIGSGTALNGCTSSLVYATAGSLLGCNPASVVNGSVSTAGRSIFTLKDSTTSGVSFLDITGTLPATLSAATIGVALNITGDNDTQAQYGFKAALSSLGNTTNAAIYGDVSGATCGVNLQCTGVLGVNSSTDVAGIGTRAGGLFQSTGSTGAARNFGVIGAAYNSNSTTGSAYGGWFTASNNVATQARAMGVIGQAWSTATVAIGGYFSFQTNANTSGETTNGLPAPTGVSALVADNGSVAANIFEARDNGTAVVKIVDGGQFQGIAGSATTPGLSFTTQTGTGWYQATNRMNGVVAQGDHWSLNAGGTTTELQLGNTAQFSWNSSDPPTAPDGDTGLKRVAAGVVGPTSGSALTAAGWLQQTAGELALNADYTNATTTFSNTALSATLISGRTYNFSLNLLASDSTAADGMKIDFNGGSATVTNFRVNCMATNDTTGATVAFTAATSTALATVLNIATMASTGTHMITCNGTFVPSSSSTFIVRAAQNAHSTGTLTITRGSWLSIRDANPL